MFQYRIDLMTGKAPASLKTHWLHPDFRDCLTLLDMDVDRLTPITRIEEKSEPLYPKNRRHLQLVYNDALGRSRGDCKRNTTDLHQTYINLRQAIWHI